MKVNIFLYFGFIALFLMVHSQELTAQDELTAEPKMTITTADGTSECIEYTGSAPIVAHFEACAKGLDSNYTARYEWRAYLSGKESSPYLIRYDETFDYTFTQSGNTRISLAITFYKGSDSISTYKLAEPFSVTADPSVLNVPNAFSPNGDGANDKFQVKQDYKSIVEFQGYIFNRWGKKLFEWTSMEKEAGWDGTFHGSDVAEGVYYCRIDAKGADGRVYKIRKSVTLLRGYQKDSSGSGGTSE